jgi:hypothetical protein
MLSGEAHRALPIETSVGAIAIVRPDTVVGWAGGYGDLPGLEKYCAGILLA